MKLMVGYDGSNACLAALEVAIRHAKAFNAEVHVVTSMIKGEEDDRDQIKRTENELEEKRVQVEKAGVPCAVHLLIHGKPPGEDLVEFVEEQKIDEVVIGVKRRSKVGKLIFGSTAQYVILKAPCPVVTVK